MSPSSMNVDKKVRKTELCETKNNIVVYCGHVSLALSSNKERFEWQSDRRAFLGGIKLRAALRNPLAFGHGSKGEDTPWWKEECGESSCRDSENKV